MNLIHSHPFVLLQSQTVQHDFTLDRSCDLKLLLVPVGFEGPYYPGQEFTLSLDIYIDGILAFSLGANPGEEIGYSYLTRVVINLGPVSASSTIRVEMRTTYDTGESGYTMQLQYWAVDAMNALNVSPVDRVPGSPLDELHRVRSFLAGKTAQALETGVITVFDDDGETPLFYLTPSESDGILTVTPTEPGV